MHTLIIIHIGHRWPHYIKDCIHQARQVNPVEQVNIVFLVNGHHFQEVEELEKIYHIQPVYIENLPVTKTHEEFLKTIVNLVDLQFRNKYWQYVFERFFLLEQYLLQTPTKSIYMIETDNLLYIPITKLAETEQLFTQDIALPFDSLERGYPSCMFFRKPSAVTKFVTYMLDCLKQGNRSDMEILGKYRKEHSEEVFAYPVLPSECNTPARERRSQVGHTATALQGKFLTDTRFPFVFDAIVYGQAVSGIDPCNTGGRQSVGYRNESALYSIDEVRFQWRNCKDQWTPYANELPIVNLHIHSKALYCFLSDRKAMPKAEYNPKELETKLRLEYQG